MIRAHGEIILAIKNDILHEVIQLETPLSSLRIAVEAFFLVSYAKRWNHHYMYVDNIIHPQ